MATMIDLMRGYIWAKGGGKGSQPKPIHRPAVTAPTRRTDPAMLERLRQMGLQEEQRGEPEQGEPERADDAEPSENGAGNG